VVGKTGAQTTRAPLAASWVGEISGTNVFVGIASNGKELLAYVCDGQTISQWFHGKAGVDNLDLIAGKLELTANNNTLQASLTKASVTGSVKIGNQFFKFKALRATGDAGLYRAEETINNDAHLSGWVVLRNGQLRGVQVNLNTNVSKPLITLNSAARIISPVVAQY
jgi:hypothetical protein